MLCCLLSYYLSLNNVGSRDHCVVSVHMHTQAFQLLNQLACLHEALYKCYAITAHTTSHVLVFL